MIISENWLKEWISLKLDAGQIANQLTMAGLEVASISRAGPELPKIVVGKIVTVEPHPDASRLSICSVVIGGRRPNLQIVCGATNARAGLYVVVALSGAVLPNGAKIGVSFIRGIESQGMLCSGAELGIEELSEGILELDENAQLGGRVDQVLGFSDQLIDIEVTPNRGDCLSILGIARELSVLTGAKLKKRDVPGVADGDIGKPIIRLSAPKACPRYVGRYLKDLNRGARTPIWMSERLRRCGVRPLNPIVDVTNYVMLELGQPMHAFDAARIDKGIIVRFAHQNERLTLLDGSEVSLKQNTLVIADHQGAIALAGVMGGEGSAINDSTENILFEAAHFNPDNIAGKARDFSLVTDAGFRFERGVDPRLPEVACHYATYLLTNICGGEVGKINDQVNRRHIPKAKPVLVRRARTQRLLGVEIKPNQAQKILKRLSSDIQDHSLGWFVTPPSFRFDLRRECDFIEELARVWGYHNIPEKQPAMPANAESGSERDISKRRIKQVLIDRDYHEAITYSFVDNKIQRVLQPHSQGLALANPLAENLAEMRLSTWPGLVECAISNLNRQHDRVRLFELGKVFPKSGEELEVLGGIAVGPVNRTQWGKPTRGIDFFDVKSDVEALLSLAGLDKFRFYPAAIDALHPGQSAEIRCGKKIVGYLGLLHPKLRALLDVVPEVYLFELRIDVIGQRDIPAYQRISRFPSVRRDLSIEVGEQHSARELLNAIKESVGKNLAELEIFDLYHPPGKSSSRKSIGFSLTLQDSSRTLTDQEVERIIKKVLDVLYKGFGANLRT